MLTQEVFFLPAQIKVKTHCFSRWSGIASRTKGKGNGLAYTNIIWRCLTVLLGGLAGYCRRFIKNFSKIRRPLTEFHQEGKDRSRRNNHRRNGIGEKSRVKHSGNSKNNLHQLRYWVTLITVFNTNGTQMRLVLVLYFTRNVMERKTSSVMPVEGLPKPKRIIMLTRWSSWRLSEQ